MSSFTVTNTTNGTTHTLANTLVDNIFGQKIPGYTQAGVSIPGGLIANVEIEGTTTGYKISGTDLGNLYCAKYTQYTAAGSGSIDVSNYSSCTIVMCGGGGGGSGGGAGPAVNARPGRPGGPGGINIIQKIPLAGVTTINYTVGTRGTGGAGATRPGNQGSPGVAGNSTQVSISNTTCTANGGSGGTPSGPINGIPGTITPATQNFTTATLNGGLTGTSNLQYLYNTTNGVINANYFGDLGKGGGGGRSDTPTGRLGAGGSNGFLRVYLYP
jgi:hypothetical protein